MNKKQANEAFEKLGGREGIAKRTLEICQEVVESGAYKRAIAGAGQLKVLAEVAEKADTYWREMVGRGEQPEAFYVSHPKSIAPILGNDGHLSQAHWEAEHKAFGEG